MCPISQVAQIFDQGSDNEILWMACGGRQTLASRGLQHICNAYEDYVRRLYWK